MGQGQRAKSRPSAFMDGKQAILFASLGPRVCLQSREVGRRLRVPMWVAVCGLLCSAVLCCAVLFFAVPCFDVPCYVFSTLLLFVLGLLFRPFPTNVTNKYPKTNRRTDGSVRKTLRSLPRPHHRGGGELCEFFEGYSANGSDAAMPNGIYSLDDLKEFGRGKG